MVSIRPNFVPVTPFWSPGRFQSTSKGDDKRRLTLFKKKTAVSVNFVQEKVTREGEEKRKDWQGHPLSVDVRTCVWIGILLLVANYV